MAKYIDAELLRQEIERLKEEYNKQISAGLISESLVSMGKVEALNKVLAFIDSLQQELVVMDCSFEGGTYRINGVEKPFNAGIAKVAILEIKEKRNDTE